MFHRQVVPSRPGRIAPAPTLASCLALVLALLPRPAGAQSVSLPMPRDLQRAVAAGTRTTSGVPGPRYWQNHARYRIELVVSPPSPTIRGTEEIVYHNESPHTLRRLVINLIGNIHKPNAGRSRGVTPSFLTDGVHIDSFAVNGRPAAFPSGPMVFTTPSVDLPRPLLPGDSVRLAFRWHYELATGHGREGVIDPTTFYLAYFYPEVAVYDDYQGWDDIAFNLRQEFYTDFNDYDVTVRVPSGYVVWGTGDLRNPGEVLRPAALARYRESLTSDTVLHVATAEQMREKTVTKAGPTLAWRFSAESVPDVAFGLSDHYDWDATSVVVDDATGRRASVQSAYNDTTVDYPHMASYARHALDFFSHEWPGVAYPYPKSTVFQGYADMEYPMMVNDGSVADTASARNVAQHEIAHTYMPFYMGIDQTRWGFMDEGWATAFEHLVNRANMGEQWADSAFRSFRVSGWIHDPSPAEDVPVITPEDVLGASVSYAHNAYGKAALGYLAVKDLLGDELFRRALHSYMDTWHGKHPSPWDFFNSFDAAAGRDLEWFWRAWYFQPSYIDRKIEGVEKTPGGYELTVGNVGGMPAPFDMILGYADGTSERVHETPAIWNGNAAMARIRLPTEKALRSVTLDGGIWMDATPADDRWEADR